MPLGNRLIAAALAMAFLAAPSVARGQGAPLAVEARGGVAVPFGAFAGGDGVGEGTGLGPVFGFEVTLGSAGRRTLYAGFAQLRFGCDEAGCPRGERYVAPGVNAGVRFALATDHAVIPWLGLGVLTTRVESPGARLSPAGVSELGFGAEASAGVFIRVGPSLAFTPAVRVSRADSDLPGGVRLGLRYLVADLGLALTF